MPITFLMLIGFFGVSLWAILSYGYKLYVEEKEKENEEENE